MPSTARTELVTLGRTLDRWLPEIIAYFETGTTNAATEGCNRKVKQVKRVACGFRNHENYVLRIALAAQGDDWLAGVEQVAIDPFTPYAKAIRRLLRHAQLIVDKFHVLRLFARAVDQVVLLGPAAPLA